METLQKSWAILEQNAEQYGLSLFRYITSIVWIQSPSDIGKGWGEIESWAILEQNAEQYGLSLFRYITSIVWIQSPSDIGKKGGDLGLS
jgi:hypothetical protein